jgi:hypothetical protein
MIHFPPVKGVQALSDVRGVFGIQVVRRTESRDAHLIPKPTRRSQTRSKMSVGLAKGIGPRSQKARTKA